tara:strand:- start:233 stop:412 length:180 start_codon:yes stop_codon:yes gene_type:complete
MMPGVMLKSGRYGENWIFTSVFGELCMTLTVLITIVCLVSSVTLPNPNCGVFTAMKLGD